MNIIPLLVFFSFIFYIYFSIHTLKLDPKSRLNQIFSVMCIIMGIWAFGYTFMIPAATVETAMFWRKVSAIGWCTIYSLILHFSLVLTGREAILKRWWTYLIIYFPGVFFAYYYISDRGMSIQNFVETDLGWTYLYSINMGILDWTFHLYYTIYVLAAIILIWQWSGVAEFIREKKQAYTIVSTFAIVFLFGAITDNILPILGEAVVPPIAIVFTLIPSYALHYSIKKYRFLAMSPKNTINDILENMSDGLLLLDENGKITMANPRALDLLGYSKMEIISIPIESILADANASFMYSIKDDKKKNIIQNLEKEILTKDGTGLSVLISASLIKDDWGDMLGMTFIFHDITERKKMEEMHLKEVHHRIKNNLQVIASLLNLQSRNFDDETIKSAFRDSQNRVRSMSLAHEKLYASPDIASIEISDYIKNLTENIFQTYSTGNNRIKLDIQADKEYLQIDKIVPVGLILNELITNSFKYAFPEDENGTISIKFVIKESEYIFGVKDDGIGVPDNFDIESSSSLGLKVVNMLVQQLEGTIEHNGSNGTSYIIKFPNN